MTSRAGVQSLIFCGFRIETLFTNHNFSLQPDHARVKELSDRLLNSIYSRVEHVVRNGDVNGYPGCVNLSFSYVEGESLLMALKVIPLGFQSHHGINYVRRKSRSRPEVHVPLHRWS